MGTFDALMESVIARAEANAIIEEGDYIGEDKLYYCGKCHTKKMTIINLLDKTRIVPCLCKCEVDKIKAEEEARKQRERFDKVMQLRNIGISDKAMRDWTFANDDGSNPSRTNAMKNYVKHFPVFLEEGKGLMLFGTVGTGKTYLAACVANALIEQGIPCMVSKISDISKSIFDNKITVEDLNKFALLVLDDLGAERKTEYMQQIVYDVIDARYRANLPIIVTTNFTREEMLHPADLTYQRIFSRLFEMTTPIEVSGQDRRQKALRENIGKTKDLLGLN